MVRNVLTLVSVGLLCGAPRGASARPAEASVKRPTEAAVEFVHEFNQQLGLTAADAQLKLEHMASNPAHFFTAMPANFYRDVRGPYAASVQTRPTAAPRGLLVGDAHYGNLMTHTGPNGQTVWGWGDCDKSGTGPLDWDLARLAAHTAVVAGRHSSPVDPTPLIAALAKGYFEQMRAFASSGKRPPGFLKADQLEGALADFVKKKSSQSQKAFIEELAPHNAFHHKKKPTAEEAEAIKAAVQDYASRLPADAPVAKPVQVLAVGVDHPGAGGSNAGLKKYLALLAPAKPEDPPVALKFKQVLPSPSEIGTGSLAQSDASKVVERAALLEGYRNPLLGYAAVNAVSCLVEPMEANNDTVDPSRFSKKDFEQVAFSAGRALAQSQLQDPAVTQPQVKQWLGEPSSDLEATQRLQRFAAEYADQTVADTRALKKKH